MKLDGNMIIGRKKGTIKRKLSLTSLQEDPNILKIEEELHAKQKWHNEILAVVKTFLVL